jgi:uncharacterized protein YkwD
MLTVAIALLCSSDVQQLVAHAQTQARSTLVADPMLSAAAACVTALGDTSDAVTSTAVRYCCDKTGVFDATIIPLFAASSAEDNLRASVDRFFHDEARKLTHFGAAVAQRGGVFIAAVVGAQRRGTIVLDHAAARPQKPLTFHGELAPGLSDAHSLLTDPRGKTSPVLLTMHDATHFTGRAQLGKAAGRYQLEVMADASDGPHVVANLAIFAGVPLPTAPPKAGPTSGAPPALRMLELINQARAQTGLPPVTINAAVSRVADAHVRDMRDHDYFAHQANAEDTLPARLRAAGLGFTRASENLAAAPTTEEAHNSLMESPGHRRNILDRDVTQVGIGVAQGRGSQPALMFVVDFITPAEVSSPDRLGGQLLTLVNDLRAAAHLTPVREERGLSAVALEHSQAMARRDQLTYVPSQSEFFKRAMVVVGDVEMHADLLLAGDAQSLRQSQNPLVPASRIGIGVVASHGGQYGDGLYWITIIYAR